MRKLFFALLLLGIFLNGCNGKKVDSISGEGWTGAKTTEMPGYGEYSDKVDDMINHSLGYFAHLTNAYNKSDGVNLKSFDSKHLFEYDKVMEIDTTVKLVDNGDYTETLILLKLQEQVLRAEQILQERNLIMNYNAKSEEWFNKMREFILETKDFYINADYLID